MILADKIINERKRNGWSQEELAEKLGVSRQSVSKWEGAQSIPDLQKIVQMAGLFSVSTDYLLKDEIEPQDRPAETFEAESGSEPVKKVSLEDANKFMEGERVRAPKLANAVSLFILCPVLLIMLAGLADGGVISLSENAVAVFGLVALFLLIAGGVTIVLTSGNRKGDYDWLETDDFETEYGVSGLVKEKKDTQKEAYDRAIVIGTVICILCPVPLIVAALMEVADYIVVCMVCLLLVMVSVGVNIIVRAAVERTSYEILLQEKDYTSASKKETKNAAPFSGAYWLLTTAVFLAISFICDNWDRSWIVWPVAGVLYAAIMPIIKHSTSKKRT